MWHWEHEFPVSLETPDTRADVSSDTLTLTKEDAMFKWYIKFLWYLLVAWAGLGIFVGIGYTVPIANEMVTDLVFHISYYYF